VTAAMALRYISPSRLYLLLAMTMTVAVMLFIALTIERRGGEELVQGHVADVAPRSITEFESLTIVDDDGVEWTFAGGESPGFTPSHLIEHQALGEQVRVWYVVEESGALRVVEIEDR